VALTCTWRRRRTANGGGPSIPVPRRPATRWPTGSPPALSRPSQNRHRHQPTGADLPQPARQVLAVFQLPPQRPQARLPGSRMAECRRQRRMDLAQPAARVLHHRTVHLETRRHRRLPHGRPRQLPHHPRHVRRHHRRHPGPRPHRHPISTSARRPSRANPTSREPTPRSFPYELPAWTF
jgi:hypothetical protein